MNVITCICGCCGCCVALIIGVSAIVITGIICHHSVYNHLNLYQIRIKKCTTKIIGKIQKVC